MTLFLVNRYFYPDETATSRMCASLAFGLAARGVAVHVVTGRRRHDGGTALPRSETVRNVTVTRVGASWFGRSGIAGRAADQFGFHAAAAAALLRLARRGDCIVACTDPPLLSVTAAAAAAAKGAILATWLHDLYPETAALLGVLREDGAAMRALLRARDASLGAARRNVAPIGRMAEALADRGVPRESLAVISHWSEGEAIRPVPPERNRLRSDWGLEDKVVVGYSGNMGRAHEFGTILDAAAKLSGRADIVFLFIGAGHRRMWIEREVARRGLRNVVMKPLQPRALVGESLSVPDIHLACLIPTLETCIIPSKLYGILAAGRPALFIGDTTGESARILSEGACGASVGIGDSAGLAGLILRYADAPAERLAAGARARTLFEERFTEAVGIAAWERLLADMGLRGWRAAGAAGDATNGANADADDAAGVSA